MTKEASLEWETESEAQQIFAFGLAYTIFRQRNAVYKDLWKEDEIAGLIAHVQHKAKRVERLSEIPGLADNAIDDAVDLVNYSLFLLRMVVLDKRDEDASTVRS